MPSIFGANQGQYQGAFRSISTSNQNGVTFGGGGAGNNVSLIQNIQVTHQQPVQNLFEIGTNRRYYVIGKASGTFSASQILGFGSSVLDQIKRLADPCTPNRTLTIAFPSSFCAPNSNTTTKSLVLSMAGVLLQSVAFSVTAQDNLINSQIQGLVTDVEYRTV